MLLAELKAGIEAAQAEAAEKRRIGDPRQSYEVTSKVRGPARAATPNPPRTRRRLPAVQARCCTGMAGHGCGLHSFLAPP